MATFDYNKTVESFSNWRFHLSEKLLTVISTQPFHIFVCVSFRFLYSHTWINYLCEIVRTCYMRRRLSQSPIFSQDCKGRALIPQMIPDRTFSNLSKMLCMSLPLREFFSRIIAHRIFFRSVSLAGIFFGNCHLTSGYFWWSVPIYAGVYCITTIHLRLSQ